jgi:TatD DNase family protein
MSGADIRFTDFHTHIRTGRGTRVLSLFAEDLAGGSVFEGADRELFFSAGIHPMRIAGTDTDSALRMMDERAGAGFLKAVGECGLDRRSGAPMDIQTVLFERQARLAAGLGLPLIIHCVKAFPELLSALRRAAPGIKAAVHGFNGGARSAKVLLDAGFYLSFGPRAVIPGSPSAEALALVPDDRLFLETDAEPGKSSSGIGEVYAEAAEIRRTEAGPLAETLARNFHSFFNL